MDERFCKLGVDSRRSSLNELELGVRRGCWATGSAASDGECNGGRGEGDEDRESWFKLSDREGRGGGGLSSEGSIMSVSLIGLID